MDPMKCRTHFKGRISHSHEVHSLVTQTNQAKSRRVATENEELKDKEEAILSLSLSLSKNACF